MALMKAVIDNAKSCTWFGITPSNRTGRRWAEKQLCRQRPGGPGGKAERKSPVCPCSEEVNAQSLNGRGSAFEVGPVFNKGFNQKAFRNPFQMTLFCD